MSETLVIVDYGSGNLRSAAKALERAAREAIIQCDVRVSSRPEDVALADRILLPGVGAFGDCAAGLEAIDGMWQALDEAVSVHARPFLGICVGMQLMARTGHEHGRHTGFGWIGGEVVRLRPRDPALKVPHMGWNTLQLSDAGRSHPLFSGIREGEHVYFVHGYHMTPDDPEVVLATTEHGEPVVAAVSRSSMAGVQFHPEKSQKTGLRLLSNFLEWRP